MTSQEIFDAVQTLSLCLAASAGMVRDMQPDLKTMKKAAGLGYATATDLADWLVRVLKMPFRDAHHVTGRLVAIASEKKVGLEKLSLADSAYPTVPDLLADAWLKASEQLASEAGLPGLLQVDAVFLSALDPSGPWGSGRGLVPRAGATGPPCRGIIHSEVQR